jgi:ABC-type transporter Mla MlaB component
MTANKHPTPTTRKESPARSLGSVRPPPRPATIVVVGPVARADIPAFCHRARLLFAKCRPGSVICDVSALTDPDVVTVDALVRMQLTARRLGRQVRLRHACEELRELLAFLGLSEQVSVEPVLRIEPGRQAEQRKQARGIEEEADSGDPIP